jgi:glycosyltransferase involved in cell wall biosynthesis
MTVPRVLMVTPRFLPEMGGIEMHVHEVSKRLVMRGYAIDILTTDLSGALPTQESTFGVRVRRIPAWPKGRDYYFAPALRREIASAECDLIHIQGCHTFVAPLAMLAALQKRVPFVITFHSGGHSSRIRNTLRRPQWWALRPLVSHARHCVGVSRYEADFLGAAMHIPHERLTVIPNGAGITSISGLSPTQGGSLIVSIGRLERYKGHHRLIEALPEVLRDVPDARLRVLGEGPYKHQLMALIDRLNLHSEVIVGGIPPTDREKLGSVLGSAALVVLLSEYEAHPVAIMEALALGRRVLVTDCSGFREMVDHDAVAAVPRDANRVQVAAAVIANLGKGPLTNPISLPTWDQCAERLAAVYQGVLN